jgi:hypothetical protein
MGNGKWLMENSKWLNENGIAKIGITFHHYLTDRRYRNVLNK